MQPLLADSGASLAVLLSTTACALTRALIIPSTQYPSSRELQLHTKNSYNPFRHSDVRCRSR